MSELLLDAAGRRRSPATLPEFHAGRPPRNKGVRYPADPPTIEEIVAVMRRAGDSVHGRRLRGLIVVLRRAGLRIHEALALAEADLDPRRGSLLVHRRGKGGRRREAGMDDWAWEQLAPWLWSTGSSCRSVCCSASSPAPTRRRPWSGLRQRLSACHFHEKLGPRLDASSCCRRRPSVSSQRARPRLPRGPEALRPRAALGGAAGLARNEGLRRVHLRRIGDADLFEDRSQVLAERVARLLGLPDVDDAESARAFAG